MFNTTKLVIGLISLLVFTAAGAEWTIRWEAAKGESECKVPYAPQSLDAILFALPAGHLEANADIKEGMKPAKSTTELLGTFKGRKVIAAELEVPQSFYSRYFLIIAEVEAGKYMPVYIHQYAQGSHGHGKPTFQASKANFSVIVSSETYGTGPTEQLFRITYDLKSPPKTELIREKGDE